MIGQPFGQTVIFLNGVSSSGKTTIARVLQATLPVPYLHVQLDTFEQMLPDRYDEGGLFDWPVLFPRLLSGFHRSIAALAGVGNNLIVDHVAVYREGWPSTLIECAYLLAPYRAFSSVSIARWTNCCAGNKRVVTGRPARPRANLSACTITASMILSSTHLFLNPKTALGPSFPT